MNRFVCVFRHPDSLLLGHVRNLLEAAGVRCELRNWTIAGGAGELPPIDCEPELWVAPHNVAHAEQVIATCFSARDTSPWPDWQCPGCGEHHRGAFDCCWRCDAERP